MAVYIIFVYYINDAILCYNLILYLWQWVATQGTTQHYICVVLAKHKLWSIYFVTLEDAEF